MKQLPHEARALLQAGAQLLMLMVSLSAAAAQVTTVAEFTVHAGAHDRVDVPVAAYLPALPLQSYPGAASLYEVTGGTAVPVTSQFRPGSPDQITWVLGGATAAGAARTFQLRVRPGSTAPAHAAGEVRVSDTGESLVIEQGGRSVLEYRYELMPVPEGVDDVFSLSGYIHPIWSPEGEVLSRIQPPDHYHHYGLWNPWTSTEFEGRPVDFWNVGSRQGRFRSAGVLERTSGEVFGGFRALHEHVDLTGPSGPKVALREQWEVTVWNVAPERGVWLIDFTSTLNPATDQPLTIKEYRYQGFSLRATERWNDRTARLLTSEGLDKSTANATRARWIDVNGVSGARAGTSGILIMTNPANFNYPEQLRIWPTGQPPVTENVFINFNPAQDRDWELIPGRTYALKYRMLVYDGAISAADAERHWADFADPPRVDVRLTGQLP
jgi:hypothetical protein